MKRHRSTTILLLSLVVSGCVTSTQKVCTSDCDDCCRTDDFCVDAVPAKPGTYVNGWNDAMRCAARDVDFVIPRNSWFNGGVEPGPQAVEDLQKFGEQLQAGDDHLIVEVEPVQPLYEETLAQASARTEQINQNPLRRGGRCTDGCRRRRCGQSGSSVLTGAGRQPGY